MENLISQINKLIEWFDNPIPESKPMALELLYLIRDESRKFEIVSDYIFSKDDLLELLVKLDKLKESADSLDVLVLLPSENKSIYMGVYTIYWSFVMDISRIMGDLSIYKDRSARKNPLPCSKGVIAQGGVDGAADSISNNQIQAPEGLAGYVVAGYIFKVLTVFRLHSLKLYSFDQLYQFTQRDLFNLLMVHLQLGSRACYMTISDINDSLRLRGFPELP